MSNKTQAQDKPKKKWSQERAMLLLTLIFAGGVVALTVIPEDTPMRAVFMPLFVLAVAWAMFKK